VHRVTAANLRRCADSAAVTAFEHALRAEMEDPTAAELRLQRIVPFWAQSRRRAPGAAERRLSRL
jgi:hypothetical protein